MVQKTVHQFSQIPSISKRRAFQLSCKPVRIKVKGLLVTAYVKGALASMNGLKKHIIRHPVPFTIVAADLHDILIAQGHSDPEQGAFFGREGKDRFHSLHDFVIRALDTPNFVMCVRRAAVQADSNKRRSAAAETLGLLLQGEAIGAHVDQHAVLREGVYDGENVLSQERFTPGDTYQMNPHFTECFGQYPVFLKGQFAVALILPPLTHLTASITVVCDIEFRHEGSAWGRKAGYISANIPP